MINLLLYSAYLLHGYLKHVVLLFVFTLVFTLVELVDFFVHFLTQCSIVIIKFSALGPLFFETVILYGKILQLLLKCILLFITMLAQMVPFTDVEVGLHGIPSFKVQIDFIDSPQLGTKSLNLIPLSLQGLGLLLKERTETPSLSQVVSILVLVCDDHLGIIPDPLSPLLLLFPQY